MSRNMICVACPLGCSMVVDFDETGCVLTVTGNQCKRGENYAIDECTAPTRTLTTTVKVLNGSLHLIPVRSAKPIPKELLLDCVKLINSVEVEAPVSIGDIIIENILETGTNIVATNICFRV